MSSAPSDVSPPAPPSSRGRSQLSRRYEGRGSAWQIVFAVLLLVVMLIGLCVGRLSIPAGTVMSILLAKLGWATSSGTRLDDSIVLLVRAPRVLLAALSGAGLAVGGTALQGIFRNPLVAPQILGISGGAAFGGALAITLGLFGVVLIGFAFSWGIIALILVGLVARVDNRTEQMTIILAGIVIGALFTALVSALEFIADPDSSLPAIVNWLLGSFATVTWDRLILAAPAILIGSIGLLLLRFRLNILSLGSDEARSFGVRVEFERWLIFVLVTLIEATVTAVAGIVGWVGLVIPHAARMLVGPDHRDLVPASALLGAAYLVLIDTLARTLTAAEIPLGVLTALVGAPVFILLLRRNLVRQGRS